MGVHGPAISHDGGDMRYTASDAFAPWHAGFEDVLHSSATLGNIGLRPGWSILGHGQCAVVLGFGPYALKLFRRNDTGLAVPPLFLTRADRVIE